LFTTTCIEKQYTRPLRIITFSNFRVSAIPLLKKLQILNVKNIGKLKLGKLMYLYKNGQMLQSLIKLFGNVYGGKIVLKPRGKIAAPMWICYFASKKLQNVAMSCDIHT